MLQSVVIIGLLGINISLLSLNVTRVRAATDVFRTMSVSKSWGHCRR